MNDDALLGMRALVTGAGSGIGAASAVALAAAGARVAAADLHLDSANATVASIDGGIAVRCDVADEASVAAAVRTTVDAFGGMDVLVTCAGITLPGRTADTTLDEWRTVIDVNLTGTFLAIRESIPYLRASKRPAIVTIGSVASLVAAGSSASYDASKGAVLQLTRAVAAEYAAEGIRANCVCPGLVRTNLAANSERVRGAPTAPPETAGLKARPPMSRTSEPEEIAAVVAFLCAPAASFMTGAAVPVDGGYTAT